VIVDDRTDRDERMGWAIIVIALLVVAIAHAGHGLPFDWDDQGQYLSHARALLDGRAYTDIGFIYTNYNNYIGPVAEPPGLPVLIAPALAVSGADLMPVRATLLAMLMLFLWFAWRVIAPRAGHWTATAVVVMTLAFTSEQHILDGVMSELPFCAAIWCVLVAADSDGELTRGRLVAMAIAGALAFTFRMAALALFPAIGLWLLLRPRREWPGLVAVTLVWAVAAALVMFALPTSSALIAETKLSAGQVLFDLSENARIIQRSVLGGFLYPFGSNMANNVLHIIQLLLTALGSWSLFRAGPRRFTWLFAVSYIVMLLVLPTRSTRYWWPLIPLQAFAMFEGLTVLFRRLPAVPRWAPAGVAVLLFAFAVPRHVREPATPFRERRDMDQVIAAVRSSPDQEWRVAIFNPRLFTWHTGIPAMGLFNATPEETIAELRDKRISYLIRASVGESGDVARSMNRTIAEQPGEFTLIGTFGELTLFRVAP